MEALRRYGGQSLLKGDQVNFTGGSARARIPAGAKNEYVNEDRLAKAYKLGDIPYFDRMTIGQFRSWNLSDDLSRQRIDLHRAPLTNLPPNSPQPATLSLRFAAVDTDELRDLEIVFKGDHA